MLDRAGGCNLFCEVSAHEGWVRGDADPAEVKPVSVPAGGNGRVSMVLSIGVPVARVVQKLEAFVGQMVSGAAKHEGIGCATCSVAGVLAIVFTAAVMEDGEEANNPNVGSATWCEQEPVALNTPPMVSGVKRIARRMELIRDELPEVVKIGVQ